MSGEELDPVEIGRQLRQAVHDFNNLLSVILNGAQFALEELASADGDVEMMKESLEDVQLATRKARDEIRRLGDLGRALASPTE
jgi:signal transduction histidine kinase